MYDAFIACSLQLKQAKPTPRRQLLSQKCPLFAYNGACFIHSLTPSPEKVTALRHTLISITASSTLRPTRMLSRELGRCIWIALLRRCLPATFVTAFAVCADGPRDAVQADIVKHELSTFTSLLPVVSLSLRYNTFKFYLIIHHTSTYCEIRYAPISRALSDIFLHSFLPSDTPTYFPPLYTTPRSATSIAIRYNCQCPGSADELESATWLLALYWLVKYGTTHALRYSRGKMVTINRCHRPW